MKRKIEDKAKQEEFYEKLKEQNDRTSYQKGFIDGFSSACDILGVLFRIK